MALEKMLILAFDSADDAESGTRQTAGADNTFEALINPESYTLDYKVKTQDGQGQGSSAAQSRYEYTLPEELSFEFLFDNTGIIDDQPKPDGVFDDVSKLKNMLIGYNGSAHEPRHLKLVWGNLLFKGRAIEVSIVYKLFNPDGQPIRAVIKAKFKGSVEEQKRVAQEYRQSPDLSHRRTVKAGDTLPLLCYQIYGDPKYYLQIARLNGLSQFRTLSPGSTLIFPPLAKTQA